MIIYKCDVCGRTMSELQTYIFYKEKIDCCGMCEWKVKDKMKEFKKEVKKENESLDGALRQKENELIKELTKGEYDEN